MSGNVERKSQKGFIKNGIVFLLLFVIIAIFFWLTHISRLPSTAIFAINFLLLLGLTLFALRFLVFPLLFSQDEELVDNSQLFETEDNLKDFRLKDGYVSLGYMKRPISNIHGKFQNFYYGLKSPVGVDTSISADISRREFVEVETSVEEDTLLEQFEAISQDFKEEKEILTVSKSQIAEDKKEIEESIKYQKEYIESVKEEKTKISIFLQEQKEDLADLLVQKEKEEAELAALASIESRVAGRLDSERGELKKLLSTSRKELDAINKKRRETIYTIAKNRNEAVRKADLIKQIQQRRMALASIKKEKLQALNS